MNEVKSFVSVGLRGLFVSRAGFKWGVPVPDDDEDHIMYVWINALITCRHLEYGSKNTYDYEKFWPAALHVVGKDIIRFNAVYWPAFLLPADLPLPKRVYAQLVDQGWRKDCER